MKFVNPKPSRKSNIFTNGLTIKIVSILVVLVSGIGTPVLYMTFPNNREHVELVIIFIGFIGTLYNIPRSNIILEERSKYGTIFNQKNNGIYGKMPNSFDVAKGLMVGSIEEIEAIKDIIGQKSKISEIVVNREKEINNVNIEIDNLLHKIKIED